MGLIGGLRVFGVLWVLRGLRRLMGLRMIPGSSAGVRGSGCLGELTRLILGSPGLGCYWCLNGLWGLYGLRGLVGLRGLMEA